VKPFKKDSKDKSKPKNNPTRKLYVMLQGQVKKALRFVEPVTLMENVTSLQTSKRSSKKSTQKQWN